MVSPRRDGTGVPVGWFAVPKTGQKNASPRGDATEVPVGWVAVPKTVQKPPSPRRDATEMVVVISNFESPNFRKVNSPF